MMWTRNWIEIVSEDWEVLTQRALVTLGPTHIWRTIDQTYPYLCKNPRIKWYWNSLKYSTGK